MRVAIIGTGKMGGAMARRLKSQGNELTLWNRTRDRAEALGAGKVAYTPAEAAQDAEVVISMLTDADAVRAAYLGEGGAAQAAKDQVFVEMSTAGPDIAKEIAPRLEAAGAKYVEAPVLGSVGAVEAGTLVVLAAGDEAAIERAHPVLDALGEVRHVSGGLGSAASLKLVANTMITAVNALAAELVAAGKSAGLNDEDVFWVLSRMAPILNTRKAGLVEHRYEPVNFALRDAVKDLRLATELYKKNGATTPIAMTTKQLYERAAHSAGDKDMSAIASLYEKQPVRRDPA
jgi:3-hydroxyisobutyrate dehydrogenase-like beta-hydroxyacid dehydrogenase